MEEQLLNILSETERDWLFSFMEKNECTVIETCKALIMMQTFLEHCTDETWEE